MKILNEKNGGPWTERINFLDDNAIFIGYGIDLICCEDADWFIADKIIPYTYDECKDPIPQSDETPDVSDYNFDPDFFQDVPSDDLDAGEMVVFKLVSKDKPDLYLHLYNCHNGYYGHGFEVKHGGITVKEDVL